MRTRATATLALALAALPAQGRERAEREGARPGEVRAQLDFTIRLRPALRYKGAGVRLVRRSSDGAIADAEQPPERPSWGDTLTISDAGVDLDVDLGADGGGETLPVRVSAGRTTVLADGGIGDAAFTDEQTRRERLQSYAQGEAEFDHYDLSLEWDALSSGAVTFLVTGGVRAISATAGRRVDGEVAPGVIATTYEDAHGMVPVPVVGGGVRFDLADGFFLSGGAATHTIPEGATLLDFTAQTGLELNPNVGFYAGYQMIQSSVEVDSINADLDQEGVFARLRIRF